MSSDKFKLVSKFEPTGDQPSAIAEIGENLTRGVKHQTLLGVTGSGKTFTTAHLIAQQQRPALIMAPNKTLAAQLYSELKEFFPENRVHYFVSYYDYYQPEAFVPSTNTYIEKDSSVNDEIDKMRHAATRALIESRDTIIVASVSCIYGIGAPQEYLNQVLFLEIDQVISRDDLINKLVQLQYKRDEVEFARGSFRAVGDQIDIFPADQDQSALRVVLFGDEIEEISTIDSLTGRTLTQLKNAAVYPTSHYVTSKASLKKAIKTIKAELNAHLHVLLKQGKSLEAQRLEQRTLYDIELIEELGFCSGIENYSRHVDGRKVDEPPTTLLDYFPDDYMLFVDESHVTVSQIGGMYKGDRARKSNLIEHGYRLPSAFDNRPLQGVEFWQRANQVVFISATPGDYELDISDGIVVEQIIRPTGLLDPIVELRPATNQVDDLLEEIQAVIEAQERVLITTLTKKMSEELSMYLQRIGVRSRYLHSDIDTLERMEILQGLRRGDFDVLIGINLLREGLDLPEVSLVAILDADKEGFLRSKRSLIQTIGRAARNVKGRAILYCDRETNSIKEAVEETTRRRVIQEQYNKDHGITPKSIVKPIRAPMVESEDESGTPMEVLGKNFVVPKSKKEQDTLIEGLKTTMFEAAQNKEFELAAKYRDAIQFVQKSLL